jgi:hypothetical protein
MAHFALLNEHNYVIFVTAGSDEDNGKEEELSEQTGQIYKQTSYNTRGGIHILGGTPLRKNYAGIGYFYDCVRDAFIPPNNFPSWQLNETTCLWEPPLPYPSDGNFYLWDETTLSWIEQER